jgi:hypothetical protein
MRAFTVSERPYWAIAALTTETTRGSARRQPPSGHHHHLLTQVALLSLSKIWLVALLRILGSP